MYKNIQTKIKNMLFNKHFLQILFLFFNFKNNNSKRKEQYMKKISNIVVKHYILIFILRLICIIPAYIG